jgi:hypothetical protein
MRTNGETQTRKESSMNDHYDPYKQAQQEHKARRMLCTLLVVQILGAMLGASAVLWITGTWPFTFDFLVGYTLTAMCIVFLQMGVIFLRLHKRQRVQPGEESIILDRGDLCEFDRLVEQQDQEIALYGEVSPITRLQLEAYAEGKPVPHVNVHSPELERLRRAWLRGRQQVRRWRLPTDDEDYWDWEAEVEGEPER